MIKLLAHSWLFGVISPNPIVVNEINAAISDLNSLKADNLTEIECIHVRPFL